MSVFLKISSKGVLQMDPPTFCHDPLSGAKGYQFRPQLEYSVSNNFGCTCYPTCIRLFVMIVGECT